MTSREARLGTEGREPRVLPTGGGEEDPSQRRQRLRPSERLHASSVVGHGMRVRLCSREYTTVPGQVFRADDISSRSCRILPMSIHSFGATWPRCIREAWPQVDL